MLPRLPRFAAIALALLAVPASAQVVPDHLGVHVLTAGPDGGVQCDATAEARIVAQARRGATARMTAVPSTNPAGSTRFRIILRATDQLLAQPEALLSFRRAAARWERILQEDVTTVIDVDYGTTRFGDPYDRNTLGSTNSAFYLPNLSTAAFVNRLKAQTTDPQLIALYDAIPVPTPSTARGTNGEPLALQTLVGPLIPLQAYGVFPATLTADTETSVPSIGFNSAFPYDFNPNDGIAPNLTDFEAVVVHEIGHALGFASIIGNEGAPNNYYMPWDLFRVRPEAVTPGESLTDGQGWETAERVVTPGPVETGVQESVEGLSYFRAVQVFFDGLAEYETSTATGSREGGDDAQASHWRDDGRRSPSLGNARKIGIMDPNLGRGEVGVITAADIRMLETIGYSVDYDPPTAEARYALNGAAIDTESEILIARPFALGQAESGQSGTATLTVTNADATTDLAYEVEFVLDRVAASGAPALAVTLTNEVGVLAPGASADVTISFSGDAPALAYGSLLLRSNDESQYVVDLPVAFAVGGAAFPSLVASGISREAVAEVQVALEVPVTNLSTLDGLGYLRILEPALSNGAPSTVELAPQARRAATRLSTAPSDLVASVQARRSAGARASIALPNATFPFGITELGDGRLLISDIDLGAETQTTRAFYLVSSDLGTVTQIASPITNQYVTGVAYDDRRGTVWLAEFNGQQMREAAVSESGLALTGQTAPLGFTPTSLSYSAELDAFVASENQTDRIHAVDRTGTSLPGYPITIPPIPTEDGRNSIVSNSFREGVLEVSGLGNELLQYDQFGRAFEGSERVVFEAGGTELMGARRFLGYVRSRVDYDGRAFYLLDRATETGDFFVIDVDPPDFPDYVGTVLDAARPESAFGTLGAGASATLLFDLDTRGKTDEEIDETLAYLVSDPSQPIVTIPVDLSVRPVAVVGEPDGAFRVAGALPNPLGASGVVRFSLGTPADVTVSVFNVLGQRVAVLAQRQSLAAGTHDLPLDASALAAGTYLVRVEAGAQVGTRTITVVR